MIRSRQNSILACLALVLTIVPGCRFGKTAAEHALVSQAPVTYVSHESAPATVEFVAAEVNSPDFSMTDVAPRTSNGDLPNEFWQLTLDEAIAIAMQDTKVLRSLGATAVQNPQGAAGKFDPTIQSTDPIFGIQAALANFDANVNSNLLYSRNDDVFNNPTLTGNTAEVRQDLTVGTFNINRVTPYGTQLSFNNSLQHEQTNNPAVTFPHSWTSVLEATVQHPLLQGRGLRFNQIAGPTGTPGFRNTSGVLVSRINHDITRAQFERGVREMVNEVITAYWQLHLAYKNFDSIKAARDGGLKTWNIAKSRFENDLPGGEADREAQAREQYYVFQSQLLAALNGDRQSGVSGVLQAEADLRRLLNLPQSGERLIRPSARPVGVATVYNWVELASQTIECRVELREQRWRVQQRQLELEAARNFVLPRLDAIATYRNNGFGDDLIGGSGRFSSAFKDATSNDHGEWEMGLNFSMPVGFRQAHAAVRNSQILARREKAVLAEQKNQILHDLGSAFRQVDQNFSNIEFAELRVTAARETVLARQAAYEADAVGFDELLDAQQRQLDAELAYTQALTNYELAQELLLLESGKLLTEHQVHLIDGSFDDGSYCHVSNVQISSGPSAIDYRF